MKQEIEIQRKYYADTALQYDEMHGDEVEEQLMALHLLASYIEFYQIRSVLDVGGGTGRTVIWLKDRFPDLIVKAIEPVEALREQGYARGLSSEELMNGDGYNIPFEDNSFDLVCEFAVLHHVREPHRVVTEMSRVASKMICISDCNFMGNGSTTLRLFKYVIFSLGLWKIADWFKTRGKGYTISEGDGLAYSYSVYQDLAICKKYWGKVRIMTTRGDSESYLGQITTAPHVLLIAFDKITNKL